MNTGIALTPAHRFRDRRLAIALAGAAASVAVAAAAWTLLDRPTSTTPAVSSVESFVDWVGPAASLDQLIDESDIVVVGRVTGISGTDRVYPAGYDPSDRHLPEGVDPGITFTHLEVQVDAFLNGDGPATLTMRQTGDLTKTDGLREFPKPEFGEPMILFLTAEPERGPNMWASDRGPWGRASAEGGSMYYAWGESPREAPWFAGMSIEEAAEQVRAAVAR